VARTRCLRATSASIPNLEVAASFGVLPFACGDRRIVGTRSSILWDGYDSVTAAVATERGEPGQPVLWATDKIDVPPLYDGVGGHLGVMQDFIAAVEGGPMPDTVGTENAKSLAMVFAAIRIAESRRRVEIES
jgi:hypothetical protein